MRLAGGRGAVAARLPGVAAEDQLRAAVAVEIGNAGAGAERGRELLAARSIEAIGAAPEDKRASAGCGERQVEPAVAVEIGGRDPAQRAGVGALEARACDIVADSRRIERVEVERPGAGEGAARPAGKDGERVPVVADGDDVEMSVAVEVGDHCAPADVHAKRLGFGDLPGAGGEVVDQEAGVLVEGVFGIVADKQLGSAVVVEVGHERVDRAPAGGLDPAVGGVAVRAARVNHDLVVAVGAAAVVVDERDADFAAGSAEEPCAAGVLAREAPRLRHELAVFETVEQRVVRVKPVPGALRKEDHVIERRYVGCRAGGHDDAVFRQKSGCGAAPDPADGSAA